MRAIVRGVSDQEIDSEYVYFFSYLWWSSYRQRSITEELLSECMYSHSVSDPSIIVRTSGETRLSDFMLWQVSSDLCVLLPLSTRSDFSPEREKLACLCGSPVAGILPTSLVLLHPEIPSTPQPTVIHVSFTLWSQVQPMESQPPIHDATPSRRQFYETQIFSQFCTRIRWEEAIEARPIDRFLERWAPQAHIIRCASVLGRPKWPPGIT